ncbi:MAG: TIM barrel protein [Verrucomicrobia bacterium]|nr:TIM barrel protein [Verrucomicrobiota bacterium]
MRPYEIGLMIWAADAEAKIQTLKQLGLGVAQIGVRYSDIAALPKRRALTKLLRGAGIEVVTLFAAFDGEDYADIPTVQRTVGLVPVATRTQRFEEAKKLSEFACELGIKNFAFHLGFVPEDPADPGYQSIVRVVRMLADECRFNSQQFCFETGQESADTLLRFIADVKTTNLKVNFDPANMVLYGSGDPVEALGKLSDYVVTVHCKDGKWPAAKDKLGVETPLGQGDVGMDRFVAKLQEIGYQGPLVIEREIAGEQQIADVRSGIALLKSLGGVTAGEPAEPLPAPPPVAPIAPQPAPAACACTSAEPAAPAVSEPAPIPSEPPATPPAAEPAPPPSEPQQS